ncbi:2-C-methyl-D-erythritol 4-phosphate cytidylyltransferase, partial [Candidatus Latescibacterota bacterium]
MTSDRQEPPPAVAIIPAAGRGRRLGGDVPKQYLDLAGKPVLWHTLHRFDRSPLVRSTVLVVHPQDRHLCDERVLSDSSLKKLRAVVDGGEDRADSVRAGLESTDADDRIVLVHDAVRPLVTEALIERVVAAAQEHGAAVPVTAATETVKVVEGDVVVDSPDRTRIRLAQTPQGFRRSVLLEALERAPGGLAATDEAMAVERAGNCPVHIVEGDADNVKITLSSDLERAAWHLTRGQEEGPRLPRIGTGYDVHPLAAGRKLILGGVEIPAERGLAGHSDADVLTHAIID